MALDTHTFEPVRVSLSTSLATVALCTNYYHSARSKLLVALYIYVYVGANPVC